MYFKCHRLFIKVEHYTVGRVIFQHCRLLYCWCAHFPQLDLHPFLTKLPGRRNAFGQMCQNMFLMMVRLILFSLVLPDYRFIYQIWKLPSCRWLQRPRWCSESNHTSQSFGTTWIIFFLNIFSGYEIYFLTYISISNKFACICCFI